MKKYFHFYRSYYDIFKELEYPKNVLFIHKLSEILLMNGNGITNAKEVIFNDVELDNVWKKVIKKLSKRDRNTHEYSQWRKKVYERDKYLCQKCKITGLKLSAHHIVKWIDSVELRYELSNGITLCEECHKKEHKGKNR